ncbi:hypothetical protein [uncultured Methylobacterium sp.]|uniref:hypothetical protein n=1 Tax=uncultured Methylobacterium sp. TaxID=157278 RepID=UPI0035C9C306
MAPGYVIALCLEGAGAVGFGIGLWARYVERRARAAELARFLRSGQTGDPVPARTRPVPMPRPAPPTRIRTAATPAVRVDPSDALLALRSAYAVPTG